MSVTFLINFACAILAISLLHNLSRRSAERAYSQVNGLRPAEAWIIYFVVFFSGLTISFHVVGAIELVTGFKIVRITTVTGIVALLWGAGRLSLGPLPREGGMLSCAQTLGQLRDTIGSVDPLVRWSVIVAGSIMSLFVLEAATRPPTGWDTLVYHLPLAVKWFQQGSLAFIQESWKFQMPSNGELFPMFLMYLGTERFLSFACLPLLLLAILAVHSLASRVTDSREGALFAALGFGTMPIVLYNAFNVAVDMYATSFFLSSVCLLLGLVQPHAQAAEKNLSLVGMAGLAFGLVLGGRYIYVPLLLFMTGLCGLVSIISLAQIRTGRWKHVILMTSTFVVCSLLPSVFWYVRNFLATGNPMNPLQFSMVANGIRVSTKALSERSRGAMPYVQDAPSCMVVSDHNFRHWLVAPWEDCWTRGWDHFSENWGLGAVFTTFVPVMTIAVVLLTIATTVRRRQVQPLHIVLLVAAVFLAYWWLNLFTMARSIIPVMGMSFVVAAVGIGALSSSIQRSLYVLLFCAMTANAVLLAAKPLEALGIRLHHQSWSHSSFYEVPPLIDELPAGSVILNASEELRNYPLFGQRWQNRVITDRALLEPTIVPVIGNRFIEQWGIEYIYYDTGQRWTLGDEVKREVLYEHVRDDSIPDHKEILYRILR